MEDPQAVPHPSRGRLKLGERHREAGWLLWQLLGELGRLFRAQIDPYLHEVGLGSPVEVWVCRLALTEGPLRLVDMAHTICLPVSTLSDMTDRLVADGFLRREPHPRDRRSTVLVATDRAREAVDRLRQVISARLEAVMTAMDDATVDQLTVGLRAMAEGLRTDDDETRRPAGPAGCGPAAAPPTVDGH